MEGPTLEFAVSQLADDGDAVGPVKSDGREVENGADGDVRAETDQIDENARDGEKPDGIDGSVGPLVDFVPDSRQGQQFVSGESPNGAGSGLNGCHGGEVEHEAGSYGEENTPLATDHVIEDLGYRLIDYVPKSGCHIAAAVGQYDSEQPATNPSKAEGKGDGPGSFDCGVLDLFGDVSSGIVVGHGP